MFTKYALRLVTCLALTSPLSLASLAQQTTPDPAAQTQPSVPAQGQASPPAQQAPDKGKDGQPAGKGKVAGTSNDRLFGALPNFLTVQAGELKPLTAKDKFKVVALGTFDKVQYPWWGLVAAVGQADNSEPAFGQGWVAYAKRYGTTAADSTIENFLVGAVLPSLIHQDPRFYQSSKGGFARRTGYAISRIFVSRSDSGHAQFNYSEIFGSASAAAISTYTYHPRSTFLSTPSNPHLFVGSDRTLANAANVWGTQVTLDTITIVLKEFWPDIQRKMSHKHKNDATVAGSSKP